MLALPRGVSGGVLCVCVCGVVVSYVCACLYACMSPYR